jgi:hypothetical protein
MSGVVGGGPAIAAGVVEDGGDEVLARLAQQYGAVQLVKPPDGPLAGRRGRHVEMRSVDAWLAKRHTAATLRELAKPLGLGRAQSAGNLTRQVDLALSKSRKLRRTIENIEAKSPDRRSVKPQRTGRKKGNWTCPQELGNVRASRSTRD